MARRQELVRRALSSAEGFVSARQLHDRLIDEGTPIGLATVYRQLNALAQSGHAGTIAVAGGQLFRACEPGHHHHHLVCESCGKAVTSTHRTRIGSRGLRRGMRSR